MKIKCLHGYFIFEERNLGDASKFMSLYGVSLVAKENYFTFPTLKDAPKYSIAGGVYLGVPATKTFEGEPWEIMRENNLIYDFDLDAVLPILSVVRLIKISSTNNYFVSSGLILPGSLTDAGSRVKEYSAWFSFDSLQFKYSEISYE